MVANPHARAGEDAGDIESGLVDTAKTRWNPAAVANELAMTGKAAEPALRQIVASLLIHAGFDSADSLALNTLSSVVTERLCTMGRLGSSRRDDGEGSKSVEDLLFHAICLRHGEDVADSLKDYWTTDVVQRGKELRHIEARLPSRAEPLSKQETPLTTTETNTPAASTTSIPAPNPSVLGK